MDAEGGFVSQQLGLTLVRWQGTYKEVEAAWLRWATMEGVLLATPQEQADQERQRADQAEQRAEQLAAQLRAMGIEPEGDRSLF